MTSAGSTLAWRLGRSLPDHPGLSKAGSGSKVLAGRERALGLRPGQPFLLMPDGSADVDVLSFFVSSSFGLLSDATQLSYAKDVRLFLSFLASQGVSWREATYDDLLNYEFWRRRDSGNPRRVSAAKFSREWAACRKFYEWQLHRGAVTTNPLSGSPGIGVGERSPRPSRAARSNRVKWLTPRAFEQWRNVGLAGLLPNGSADPMWRGRNSGRNVAFAHLLWASGLRLREAATLLVMELPSLDPDARYLRGRVGQAVAKGRGRDFWMSADARTGLEGYVLSSRAAAIKRAQREDRYDAPSHGLTVLEHDRDRLRLRDGAAGRDRVVLMGELNGRERARLIVDGPSGLEPAMLFLGESGLPMDYPTWGKVFENASRRCRRLGVPIGCHPHMLRHSFALRMLLTLTHVFDRRMGLTPEERREYRLLFGDPWVLVQTLLGHSNPETTRDTYLEPVSGLQVELFLNGDEIRDDVAFSSAVQRHLAATGLVNMGTDA